MPMFCGEGAVLAPTTSKTRNMRVHILDHAHVLRGRGRTCTNYLQNPKHASTHPGPCPCFAGKGPYLHQLPPKPETCEYTSWTMPMFCGEGAVLAPTTSKTRNM